MGVSKFKGALWLDHPLCKAFVYVSVHSGICKDDKELQLKQKQYAAKTFERKLRYIFEEFFSFKWLSWCQCFFLLVLRHLGCQAVRLKRVLERCQAVRLKGP